nr:uncharacterized protein LOC129280479 [Lytechinus pictus]
MGEISKLINQNIVAAEDIAAKVNEKDCDLDALQDILTFKAYDIEQLKLKYNRTVCTNQRCIRHVEVGQAKISHVVYEKICHDECRIPGFLGSIIGSLKLYLCDAIGWDGVCRVCGHRYKEHMHIAYETILTEKEFFSPEVQREVQMLSDQKQQKELLLANINDEISASKREQATIIKASAQYAVFYKANALLPFNDAVVDFLHMAIRQEKESPIRNESLLKNLEKTLKDCEKKMEELKKALKEAANKNISTPKNVNHLKNELFGLPLYGKKLREMSVSIKNAVKREEIIATTSELVASNDSKGATARLSDWLISLPTLTEKY